MAPGRSEDGGLGNGARLRAPALLVKIWALLPYGTKTSPCAVQAKHWDPEFERCWSWSLCCFHLYKFTSNIQQLSNLPSNPCGIRFHAIHCHIMARSSFSSFGVCGRHGIRGMEGPIVVEVLSQSNMSLNDSKRSHIVCVCIYIYHV